ncbi:MULTISPECIES: YfjI family protein [unclassified Acinetobacter]|uniref:YfjI family protein n=1 Tax=unclassified Acinetobacter TaxID=196816 RepID=UPI00211F2EF2|nr:MULTISPECIES: YfjI family protein [unclassified Acinetobacter]
MTAFHEAPKGMTSPDDILAQCTVLMPTDKAYIEHELIQHFGSPEQKIHVDDTSIDDSNININGVRYDSPIVLPIYNGHLELVQCAVMQDEQKVAVMPDGLAKGFARYGHFDHAKPVIVTYDLEAFFKIAQTGYAVALVLLPTLCSNPKTELKPLDLKQIEFVINQLAQAGYQQLYMPIRPEHLEAFKSLEENTAVRLLNQFQDDLACDLSQYDHADDVQAFLNDAIEQLPKPEWGELLPLKQAESVANNPYPIDALPLLARDAVLAISEHVQSPTAMTAQCVIGAMSHIAQSKVNTPNRFNAHGEPCSLFLLTEGQSGSRKSTSKNLADRAILNFEKKQYEIYRADLEQWKSGQAGLPKKDREAYCAENPPPNDPSTIYSDFTLESIAGFYIDGILRNASISTDEAGQFFGGHTMKADTRNQALGGYAKIFDDGYVERTRSKSNLNGSGRAHDVRLTFNLQGQHEVLADALKDPVLRGQGFLPRFILTIPENLAGTRLQDAAYRNKNANKDHRLIAYWTRCEYLLDSCPQVQTGNELHNGRYVIPMNEEAIEIDAAFYNIFESLQGAGKRYEYLQAFASRASQLARRLATVFAYFEGLQQIDGKTLQGACEVVKHSLNEWAMYAEIEVKAESDAEKLIKWLIRNCAKDKTDRLLYSKVQTSCPRPMQKSKKILEMVVQQLEDSNHIKIESLGRTRYVVINPLLLES